MTFELLAQNIESIQTALQQQAAHAVNLSLTARNWLVGWYIVEYEQNGEDRAQYGEALLKNLAKRIHMRGLGERRLYEFRLMYNAYPQLGEQVLPFVLKFSKKDILRLPTAISDKTDDTTILRSVTAISSSTTLEPWQTSSDKLFNSLSATHLVYLANIKEPLKRAFYEHEAITGCWTIKELDRQVSSLYYERMGLSKDKQLLHKTATKGPAIRPQDIIRDPVALEFLDLPEQAAYTETTLETAILNHLQQFLLELGNGFCFEARQKRILIDNDYFKADLIFYHRILKCHLIVELKTDRFRHEYASQLNMYLNYYRHEVMQPDDNPPIGLLLCSDYGKTTVQYATEGLADDMLSGKLNLNDALNPTLLFDAAGFGVGTVSVMGSTDGNAPTTLLGTYSLSNEFSTVKVPLTVLQGGRYAQISLVFDIENPTEIDDWTGEILSEGDGLMIDNIRIVDLYEHNLAVSVEAPSALQAGKQGIATATVTNWGEQAASGYTVTIGSDGEELLSETVTTVLAPFQSARYTVDLSASIFESGMEKTLKAEVTYADEQVPEDNAAETHYLIKEPTVKSPEQLTATDKEGAGVDLSWEAPTVEMIDYVEEFDDTEAFPTFSDGGISETEHHGLIGEWTLYDGNGLGVYSWQDPRVVYDNKYEPTAWLPFDLAEAGFTDEVGHSGTQVMLSMCPSEADASGQLPAADHWLISPELPGIAQEISFYLRAITNQYGSESVEVWASSTDNQPESFELVEQYLTDATEWTQLFAQLPEGTKYFAIRHTSTDIFGVMLDDVSFRYNGGTVKSYNIYYEGTLLATVEGGVTTYHVSPDLIEVGERTFSVSAIYANGQESKPVSATILVTTDIHELTVGQQPIDIYTIDGKLVRSSATSLDGLRGIYVVNGKKVMISGR